MPEMNTRLPYNTVPLKRGGFAGSGGLALGLRNTFFAGLSVVPCARAVLGAATAAAATAAAGAFFRNALRFCVLLCSSVVFDLGILFLLIGVAATDCLPGLAASPVLCPAPD